MNKYLEKIAEETKSKKLNSLQKFGIGYTGLIAGGAAGGVASQASLKSLGKDLTSKGSVDKATIKKILKNENLDVTFSAAKSGNRRIESLGRFVGPFAMHKGMTEGLTKNYIGRKIGPLGPNPDAKIKNLDTIVHELGHIKDFNSYKNIKSLATVRKFSNVGSSVGGLIGAGMLTNDKTKDYAPIAPLVLNAPILHGEAAANYHGYKMLGRHGTKHMQNQFLKKLVTKNTINYLSMPATLGLGLYGAKKLIDNHDKK